MSLGPGVGEVIGAGIGAAGSLFGASQSAGASNRAAQYQMQAHRESLAFAREQAEEERRRWEDEVRRADAAWASEQAYRAPYRNAGLSILGGYGFDVPASAYQTPDRPEGWMPGMPDQYRSGADVDPSGFGAVRRRTPTASRSIGAMMGRA